MSPQIALIGCIGFVGLILYLEHKHFSGISRASWIPTLWMVYASSKPLGRWFGSEEITRDIEMGSPLDRTFIISLLIISIFILGKRSFRWSTTLKKNGWLVALIGFMLISIIWSDIPFLSFKRWVRQLPPLLTGFLLLTEGNPLRAFESVLRRTFYFHIPVSWLLIKYFSEFGIEYHSDTGARMWVGVAVQKNGLGQIAALCIFFFIWSLLKKDMEKNSTRNIINSVDIFIMILALVLLRGPSAVYSATAIVVLFIAVLGMIAFIAMRKANRYIGSRGLALIMAAIFIYGTLTPFIGKLPIGDVSALFGRDRSLTDRDKIWAGLVPLAMTKPLLGHGYGGFWTSISLERFKYTAHNGYLEIMLVLGFIGLLLFLIFILSSVKKAQSWLKSNFDWGVLWICWIIMTIFNNITESFLPSFSNLLFNILIWLSICFNGMQDTSGSAFVKDK